jgi:hypothetical protein
MNLEKTRGNGNSLFFSIDAKCSFGKGLFSGVVDDVQPSQVRFLKGSKLDFNLKFGCSIVVEVEPEKWENFRSFYAELYMKLSLELTANDATKRIKIDGDVDELRAVNIRIFKQKQAMVTEQTAMTMMLNMGLGMAKSQAKQFLNIPSLGYPTIKK